VLGFQHAGEACHDLFMLAEAVFMVVGVHMAFLLRVYCLA
jgi:hypothetical protein